MARFPQIVDNGTSVTVDDLVRGAVGNQTRRALVEHLCAWLRARPQETRL